MQMIFQAQTKARGRTFLNNTRKSFLLLAFTFFLVNTAQAQSYFWLQGASNLQGGTAKVDVWSANNNQAALDFSNATISAGVDYQSRFLVSGLAQSAGAFSYKTSSGTFGFSYSSFGYEMFKTNKFTLGFGKRLGENFAMGVGLNYINLFLGDIYGSKGIFTFDVGLLARVHRKLDIGAHVFNPIRAGLGDYYDEKIPVIFNVGVNWKYTDKLHFMLDLLSNEVNQLKVIGSMEYVLMEMFYLRLGMHTQEAAAFNFGAGLKLGDLYLDFSSSMHQVLGTYPGFSLRYNYNK
jgi:hypothetical protein